MLLGHGHPEVMEAIFEQLPKGMTFFANNAKGIELAEEICSAVKCAEKVRYVSSGGEADNMINCLSWCEENDIPYGVLTGFESNNTIRKTAKSALWNYHIASTSYGVVECVHQIFLHGVV